MTSHFREPRPWLAYTRNQIATLYDGRVRYLHQTVALDQYKRCEG